MQRDPLTLLAGLSAGTILGYASPTAIPILVGLWMTELGLGAEAAGLLATAELAALGVGSAVVAWRSSWSRRRLAVAGALLAAVGQTLSVVAQSNASLAACRGVAGFGEGLALAAAGAAAARALRLERLFALASVAAGVTIGLLLFALPYAIAAWGSTGAYLTLAFLSLLCWPPAALLPERGAESERFGSSWPRPLAGSAALLSMVAVALGWTALWTFVATIGLDAGLTPEGVGLVLGLTTVAGLAGAGLAAVAGDRWGRTLPLVSATLCVGLALGALGFVDRPSHYAALLLLSSIAYFFVGPYFSAVLSLLDRYGRWIAAAAAAGSLGVAVGPAAGGWVVERWSHAGVGWLAGGATMLGLVLLTPALIDIGANSGPESRSPVDD